jgi:hypothetical protein
VLVREKKIVVGQHRFPFEASGGFGLQEINYEIWSIVDGAAKSRLHG